jgi:hypothetical protein
MDFRCQHLTVRLGVVLKPAAAFVELTQKNGHFFPMLG